MHTRPLPPLEVLRQILDYDPGTGRLTWLPRSPEMFDPGKRGSKAVAALWNARYAGADAMSHKNAAGYRVGKVLGSAFLAHRIIWLLHTGSAPEFIDHINGDKSDNRFENLRSVSFGENARNRPRPSTNTSGVIGVHWCNTNRKWVAQIRLPGERHQSSLGMFHSKDEAIRVRRLAEQEQGFHENHGRPPLDK